MTRERQHHTMLVYYVIILLYEGYDSTQLVADGNSLLGIRVIIYPYQFWISLPATSGLKLARDLWITSGYLPGAVKHSVGGYIQDGGTNCDWLCVWQMVLLEIGFVIIIIINHQEG